MPKYTPRGGKPASEPASETSDQQTVVDKDTLALCVIELLNDESVLNLLKEILFPKNLIDSISTLTSKVDTLTREVDNKNETIKKLEARIDRLEEASDAVEQ